MSKTAVITTRIEPEIKLEAENILAQLGITMSQAMSMYIRQLVWQRGIPFSVKIPNHETVAAIQESKNPEDLPVFDNLDDLFESLEI